MVYYMILKTTQKNAISDSKSHSNFSPARQLSPAGGKAVGSNLAVNIMDRPPLA